VATEKNEASMDRKQPLSAEFENTVLHILLTLGFYPKLFSCTRLDYVTSD